jgi:HAE1 family hydrophobic/amphiphilic exporter-1
VGGLVVSQLLTLYITPVFYIYMERFQGLTAKLRKSKKALAASADGPDADFGHSQRWDSHR